MNWPRFFNQEFPSMWLRVQLVGYKPHPASENMPPAAASIDETFGECAAFAWRRAAIDGHGR